MDWIDLIVPIFPFLFTAAVLLFFCLFQRRADHNASYVYCTVSYCMVRYWYVMVLPIHLQVHTYIHTAIY